MASSMDDRRLAGIERHLAQEDPGLVSLMDALSRQFPHEPDDADRLKDNSGRSDLCRRLVVALITAALVGLLLAAFFTKRPPADDNQEPPARGLAPAVAVHTQRSSSRARTGNPSTLPEQRASATVLPRRETYACR
ncbi:hypothetical protein [Streptomyces sp. UG1]|uniref:hypothetical protein n=1 Tax=Streptomyces sp. UG1 TaxID=3417652 RepID=UPI003CEF57F8